MSNSLEHKCEELIIQLLRAHPTLSGLDLRHHDDARKVKSECIVVQAVQGERNQDGPKGFDVSVTAEFRSHTAADRLRNDSIAGCLTAAIYSPRTRPDALDLFSDLVILDETSSERNDTQHLRRRTRTFALIAKEKSPDVRLTADSTAVTVDNTDITVDQEIFL